MQCLNSRGCDGFDWLAVFAADGREETQLCPLCGGPQNTTLDIIDHADDWPDPERFWQDTRWAARAIRLRIPWLDITGRASVIVEAALCRKPEHHPMRNPKAEPMAKAMARRNIKAWRLATGRRFATNAPPTAPPYSAPPPDVPASDERS
jgi:hypothetical protein